MKRNQLRKRPHKLFGSNFKRAYPELYPALAVALGGKRIIRLKQSSSTHFSIKFGCETNQALKAFLFSRPATKAAHSNRLSFEVNLFLNLFFSLIFDVPNEVNTQFKTIKTLKNNGATRLKRRRILLI
jgi:hypothetical protein